MATLRSDSNSVPNSSSLTALRKRLTTWFQQLHRPRPLHKKQGQQEKRFYKYFVRSEYSIWGEKTLERFKKIRKKFKTVQEQQHRQRVQLSSTLITSTTSTTITSEAVEHLQSFFGRMTIMEGNYINVREDYPDIDKEIRAVLVANCQNGLTISNIKKEYRKLTGTRFPLIENITDFLLTIPLVTAECNEVGTRIFNVKPGEKNQHLHEMIQEQRQRDDANRNFIPSSSASSSSCQIVPPRLWRNQNFRRRTALRNMDFNFNYNQSKQQTNQSSQAVTVVQQTVQHLANVAPPPYPTPPPCCPPPPPPMTVDYVENNWCYQDNWNHLKNHLISSNNHYQQTNNAFMELPEQQQNILQPELHPYQPPSPPPEEHEKNLKRRRICSPVTTNPTSGSSSLKNESIITLDLGYDAFLLDFPLVGDDFLLYLARMELNCRFKKRQRVLQSGLCVSGQTINAARRRLQHVNLGKNVHIIINIGSVDIMKGRPLVQIEHDFRQLLNEMHKRSFIPILTTLAPLANYRHDKLILDKVLRFNKFIKTEGSYTKVIDIYTCLVNERGVVRFDCYQSEPRSVTGSSQPYVFWNKIGRQRVLQMIEAGLEY